METTPPASAWAPRAILLLFLYCAGGLLGAPASLLAQQAATSAAPREYDLKEYEIELDRCAESIQKPNEIHQLRNLLPPAWVVRVGKTRVEVSTEPITAELRELDARPRDAAKSIRNLGLHLRAMHNAAVAMEASEETESAEAVKGRLDKILARREFRGARGPSTLDLFLARTTRWITERLTRLFMRLHIGAQTGNALAWGVIILAFVVLCHIVWRWLSGKSRIPETEPAPRAALSDARHWVEEALAAADRGEFREAIHCAYWGAVAKLEDINILIRDRARTPRESLRLLEHHPIEQRLLCDLTQHFELIWYGCRPASLSDWSRTRDELEKMGCLKASTAPTANS